MFGSIISAGAGIIGGIMNSNNVDKTNKINQENMLRQEALQQEFAKNSIQWKAKDALDAGIHPLYAMGAPTTSYSPSIVGAQTDTSMGSAVASAGQDISRAMQATQSQPARDAAFVKTSQSLQLQRMGLENELLASQIAKQRGQIGPAMPTLNGKTLIDGQPATALVTPAGAAVKADDIKQTADTIPATNRIRPAGIRLYTNPNFSDAEHIETRYGDIAQEISGASNLVGDIFHTYWPRNEQGGYKNIWRTRTPRRTGRTRGSWN